MAAFGTALVSHVLIDALGDVLLTNDTYDHVSHHSRLVVFAIGGLVGCGFLLHLWLAAFHDARGSQSKVREILAHAAAARMRVSIIVATIVASILLLVAMESLDAYLAYASSIDLITALGGSVWLSLSTTCIVGGISGSIVCMVLARIATAYTTLVIVAGEAILAILGAQNIASVIFEVRYELFVPTLLSLMARRGGKRAPPLSPRLRSPLLEA